MLRPDLSFVNIKIINKNWKVKQNACPFGWRPFVPCSLGLED
jgi:hypothetical protein